MKTAADRDMTATLWVYLPPLANLGMSSATTSFSCTRVGTRVRPTRGCSLKSPLHSGKPHGFSPDRQLPDMKPCVSDQHLRQCVTNRWKYVTIGLIREWLIEAGFTEPLDGGDDPKLCLIQLRKGIAL